MYLKYNKNIFNYIEIENFKFQIQYVIYDYACFYKILNIKLIEGGSIWINHYY